MNDSTHDAAVQKTSCTAALIAAKTVAVPQCSTNSIFFCQDTCKEDCS